MEGRLRLWLVAGLAAVALPSVGCRFFQKDETTLPNATLPMGTQQASSGGWFGGNKKPAFGPVKEDIPVRVAGGKKEFKADTYSAFADAELEMAYDDNVRPDADRDSLIDVSRRKFEEALKRDPKSRSALLGLGKLWTWAGDRDRAMQAYNKAVQAHPTDHEVAWAMSRSCVKFEDWAGAIQGCDLALKIDPQNRTYMKAKGFFLARQEKWDAAFDTLLNVMAESEARTFLGRTLIGVGRTQDGLAQLQMAVKANPNNEIAVSLVAQMTEAAPTTNPDVQLTGGTR
jgi:tetratricopeptide (TPR) repeat protein